MAQAKKDKSRKKKLEKFKQKAKKMSEQQKTPKTQLIPVPEWQSTDELILRGDLLEALDQQLQLQWQAIQQLNQDFQKTAQVVQMIIGNNIQQKKIILKYRWNNGEEATEAEVAEYEEKMRQLQLLQKQQIEKTLQKQNASVTGLVGPDGSPVGTTQNLDENAGDDTEEEAPEATLEERVTDFVNNAQA